MRFGVWLSLVECLVRDQEAGGSNPLTPTTKNDGFCFFLIKMNYEKQKQSGGKDEQFRLFVLFVLRKAL